MQKAVVKQNLNQTTMRPQAMIHWVAVIGIALVLLIAAMLTPVRDSGLKLAGFPLPQTCSFKAQWGVPCPGCGLTRSWVAAVHGQWNLSWGHHRLGMLLLFYTLLQWGRHFGWLVAPHRQPQIDYWGRFLDYALVPLALLMLINWTPNLYQLFTT